MRSLQVRTKRRVIKEEMNHHRLFKNKGLMTFLLMQVTELPIKIRMIARNRPFSGHNRRFDLS